MAVARKPRRGTETVDDLIERGGSAPAERQEKAATTAVPLRLPRSILERVDRAVAASPIPLPRNTWILHALLEKLERDGI